MRTDAAARYSPSSLLLIVSMAALLVVGSADARPQLQQDDRIIEEEGLKLVRHVDGTYEVSADGVALEALVAHLVDLSGAEFTISPELLLQPVTIETDRIGLARLLEQLRASLEANLILAATREHQVSRVWLTSTNATSAAATTAAGTPAGAAAAPTPGLQTMPVPPGAMPAPTGNEVRVAGLEAGVNVADYIRNQAAANATAGAGGAPGATAGAPGTAGAPPGAASGAPGAAGGPPGEPGAQPGAEGEPPAQTEPPVPMDPNALETYFAGDKTTSTYHRLNCIQAMYLPAANKIWFKSRQEAIAAGFTPHEICVAR